MNVGHLTISVMMDSQCPGKTNLLCNMPYIQIDNYQIITPVFPFESNATAKKKAPINRDSFLGG